MEKVELAPYLFFQGNCREAMEFYKDVFGGELKIQTMNEVPPEAQMPEADPNDVMHARLDGGLAVLMASDSKNASPKAAKIELSLSGSDEAQLREVFDKLAEDGKVNMPLSKMFWGDLFGQLSDKYGVDWMVNISAAAGS